MTGANTKYRYQGVSLLWMWRYCAEMGRIRVCYIPPNLESPNVTYAVYR